MTIKIAVPNKGSLSDSAIAALRESGYRQRNDPRDLSLIDAENDVEFYYLRPRDIALYVGSGELDAGITGRDLLLDSSAAATSIVARASSCACISVQCLRLPEALMNGFVCI